ncbi:hypothetical protein C8R47DRAFT_1123221 [Mycena vitilis]|nr:hypothetical protein C8R47DRAFT_1123221 [Mycena vitilis]
MILVLLFPSLRCSLSRARFFYIARLRCTRSALDSFRSSIKAPFFFLSLPSLALAAPDWHARMAVCAHVYCTDEWRLIDCACSDV